MIKYSKAAEQAHPVPPAGDGEAYALACKATHEARVAFDAPKPTPSQRLDAIGIDVICEYVSSGNSLRSWCKSNGFAQQTVIDWIDSDKERAGHYAHARDERDELVFDSLDDVSDQAVRAETAVEVAGLRLKSDNIKWKLARMNAKKYGDKLAVGGADDLPPVQFSEIVRKIVRSGE